MFIVFACLSNKIHYHHESIHIPFVSLVKWLHEFIDLWPLNSVPLYFHVAVMFVSISYKLAVFLTNSIPRIKWTDFNKLWISSPNYHPICRQNGYYTEALQCLLLTLKSKFGILYLAALAPKNSIEICKNHNWCEMYAAP